MLVAQHWVDTRVDVEWVDLTSAQGMSDLFIWASNRFNITISNYLSIEYAILGHGHGINKVTIPHQGNNRHPAKLIYLLLLFYLTDFPSANLPVVTFSDCSVTL